MNQKTVSFFDFQIEQGYIACSYKITDQEETTGNLYFKLVPEIRPRNDLIAIALSTVCYGGYSEVSLDLPISTFVKEKLQTSTRARWIVKEFGEFDLNPTRTGVVLNFSGGLDSLAAKALMPDDTKLVSMDFGGRFARERKFFEKFNTHIVSTNLVDTPLRYKNWSYMGIGSILFHDYLDAGYYTFGGILEASSNNFTNNPSVAKHSSFPPFEMLGMKNAPYVIGITESATLNIAAYYYPDLVSESLNSLANVGEEKWYRKQLLASISEQRFKQNLNLPEFIPPKKQHFKFGQYFTSDFLTLYIMKHAGIEKASYTIFEIPSEAEALVNRLSLDFYDRINPDFLEYFPKPLMGNFASKLSNAGVVPYTRKDWQEFNEVREFLSKYHTIK